MAVSKRERNFLMAGGLILGLFALYLVVLRPLHMRWAEAGDEMESARESYEKVSAELQTRIALEEKVDKAQKALKVQVPKGTPNEQLMAFVQQVENLGRQNGMAFSSMTPNLKGMKKRKGALEAGDKISFTLQFTGNQQGLVKYLWALETCSSPVDFEKLSIQGDPNQPDQIKGSFVCSTWIFDGGSK